MEQVRIRIGGDDAWLELERTDEEHWRITADWCSSLTADFTAFIGVEEAVDFTERMRSRVGDPLSGRFSAAVTPARNNPLTLKAERVDDGYAFFVRLTPNGHDEACCVQLELGPVPAGELWETFDAAHAALVA
ncbi:MULTISPECIES: hypothetical protein [Streptomyces]|uniref:Uncharacterized protein n=1 Tax=Streptomyces tsukubensis (strain DSM 42081 / NBRC 108919 / NRRL 18488 / 9993) TaxID=1114943 RepID=I2N0D9_STRT9|nr:MULTISPECIES: hypothetical protein [Streptomyces]AZK94691.1 hypothetical protein B7R87_13065 [Streptomyces tsukubensis]EIF90486.1 hypothetical protein [Streptomyces tsukubensis NRRL18488]MYS63891.1 hypothetical protein [Streptomyces sp. SID5473]QKM69225.1 hypothetical protein STSU_020705 [Streptomyces tsukubensis NRRL18488]TAI42845.1 hypothetical protein EWI31_20830 [Streptomyces tsukubensis]